MASNSLFTVVTVLTVTLWVSLISPACSLTCTSQNITSAANGKTYANCTDLPTLNSYLHYTYNASNSSLSIAFVSTPAKSDGWVAWAINPTATGMIGSQAFIAFKTNGSLVVKMYNISSYGGINETNKLSFDVWNLSATSFGKNGSIAIFATVKLPEKMEKLNQVWQVGAQVVDGRPAKHDMQEANLKAKNELMLVAKSRDSASPAPAPVKKKDSGAGSSLRVTSVNLGFFLGIFVFLASFGIF